MFFWFFILGQLQQDPGTGTWQWSMVSVLKTGFDNPVVWTGGPEERKLHESGFNSIQQRQER
jgi:hypothetical protein